jgi:hypothetical protein
MIPAKHRQECRMEKCSCAGGAGSEMGNAQARFGASVPISGNLSRLTRQHPLLRRVRRRLIIRRSET